MALCLLKAVIKLVLKQASFQKQPNITTSMKITKMKSNSFCNRQTGFALSLVLMVAGLKAAPLTWFPGPPLAMPVSGAAYISYSGGDLIIGGDSWYYPAAYPQVFYATNQYWMVDPSFYNTTLGGGAVASGGQILYFGGTDGTNSQAATINYSPSDGQTAGNPMLTARSYFGYAGDSSGNAYAFGGLDTNDTALASSETYNQDAGTWSATASLPQALFDFPALFNHTNLIYIFGGLTNSTLGNEVSTVRKFSTQSHSWTTLAPLPVPTAGSTATYGPDGNIYVIGGTSGGVPIDTVQVYNPVSNSWTIATSIPEALTSSTLGVDSLGRLVVAGGSDTNGNDVGDVWLSQELNEPDSAPVLTNFPTTAMGYNSTYSSSFAAIGNPQPVYLLVSGPPGMTVDYYTGAINWTPQALSEIGSNPVTVAATNYAGVTNYSFNINVLRPPPSIPTNIQEIAFTDNTGTISCSPEDPSVGPVTYSIAIPHPYHSPKGSGGGVNYQVIYSGITTNVFTLGGAPSSSTTYSLSVTASNGVSTAFGYSTWFTVTTSGPQGPANLWVTALTSSSISLEWTPSPGPGVYPFYTPVVSYSVMEQAGSPPTNFPVLQNLTGTNATITGLTPGSTHSWWISGLDAQGFYSPLASVSATWINPIPKPAGLSGNGFSANGAFQFTITPATVGVSQTTLVQATTNLQDPTSWITIYTNPVAAEAISFMDPAAASFPFRFYRVVSP